LVAYLLFCLFSVAWSDDQPYVLVKRWIKELGNPIIALVLLTERRPYEALATTIKRLAFVSLPVSVLLIKYIPELGRAYASDGSPTYTGIGEQKNSLGLICLTTVLCYTWTQLHRREPGEPLRLDHHAILIAMLLWLMYMANSQTALLCAIVAVAVLVLATRPFVTRKPARVLTFVAVAAVACVAADATIGIKGAIIGILGRDSTLTNRTTIWNVVSSLHTNPVVGVGFMSFWSGERLAIISRAVGTGGLNQAHNGYLEQYLNLGYMGLAFIGAIIIAALLDVRRQLSTDYAPAVLRLCLILVALLYNYTEASFYGVNNMWLLLITASMDASGARPERESSRSALFRPATHRLSAVPTAVPRPASVAAWRRPAAALTDPSLRQPLAHRHPINSGPAHQPQRRQRRRDVPARRRFPR
jgi:O-antigen ligase